MRIIITSSFARFTRLATSPSFAYMINPVQALQLLLHSRLHRSASTAAPRLHPLQLLLAACIHFSCCSRLRPFNCSSIASASAAAPRLRPLLLPDCVQFNCSSPIASASTAAPRQLFLEDSSPCPMFLNILRRVRGSVN